MWWETVSLRFHLRKWHIYGNLRQNIEQKAQTGFWKRVKIDHFLAPFFSKPPLRTLWHCWLWMTHPPQNELFFAAKGWKMSDFLSHFCEILPTNLKFLFFALFPHLISDIIAFGCKNHVFFVCFRVFSHILGDLAGFPNLVGGGTL